MRKFAFSTIILAFALGAGAQESLLRDFEAEVFVGPNFSLGKSPEHVAGVVPDSKTGVGIIAGAEVRYNLRRLPVDVGVQGAFASVCHSQRWAYHNLWSRDHTVNWSVAAVGDWQFNRGGNVSPFVGMGAGAAWHDLHGVHETTAVFLPRFGMELFDRLRVSVGAQISKVQYNNMTLTVGWTFGGYKGKLPAVDFSDMFKSGRNSEKAERKARREWLAQTHPAEWETIAKLRRQANTCKWVGVGTLCLGVPTLVFGGMLAAYVAQEKGDAFLPAAVLGAGGLLTLSSIPLFIVSHNKSVRANRLTLDISAMPQPVAAAPAVGLTLAF